MLQAIDDATAARRLALDQWQRRVGGVLASIEALAASPSVPDAEQQLADAEAEWGKVTAVDTFELDPDTAGRFGALVDAARTAIATDRRNAAERRAAEERDAAQRVARQSLCERLENARAEDALDEVEKARSEWEGLPGPSAEEVHDTELKARFAEACRRAAERHQNRQESEQVNARLNELSAEAERLSAEDQYSDEAWQGLQQEWESLHPRSDALDPSIAERYAIADARVRQRAEDRRAAAERTLKQQAQRHRAVDRARHDPRVGRRSHAPRSGPHRARGARGDRRAAAAPGARAAGARRARQGRADRGAEAARAARDGRVEAVRERRRPGRADRQDGGAPREVRLRHARRGEARRSRQGRARPARDPGALEAGGRRAARAGADAVASLPPGRRSDPGEGARVFFAQRVEERKGNLERKLALIERAEALAQSTDWIKTAEELKKLQAEWQAIGPVPRQDTRVTWKRFREACDRFFTRRNADLAERKETWSANLARKEALCARAEELALNTEWERTATEIRRLQADWKSVGPVRRTKSEALWQRFRAACDTFFDRYKRRDQIELEARQADREALVTELEALVAAGRTDLSELHAPEVMGDIAPPEPGPSKTRCCSSRCDRCGTAGTSRRRRSGRAPIPERPLHGRARASPGRLLRSG